MKRKIGIKLIISVISFHCCDQWLYSCFLFFAVGKQVSAAFDFLNNYMSDDEETVFADSRRQSPLPFDT